MGVPLSPQQLIGSYPSICGIFRVGELSLSPMEGSWTTQFRNNHILCQQKASPIGETWYLEKEKEKGAELVNRSMP